MCSKIGQQEGEREETKKNEELQRKLNANEKNREVAGDGEREETCKSEEREAEEGEKAISVSRSESFYVLEKTM